jgi:hypothetical protein
MTPNSTSFHFTDVQDTRLPLSIENLYYNGCRITSDSLTTDSPDTPDGGPVVEISEVDSNVLVFSGQSGDTLSTEEKLKESIVRQMPVDELVSVQKDRERKVKPLPSDVSENQTLRPLPFVPRNTKPKLPLREDRGRNILNSILKRRR